MSGFEGKFSEGEIDREIAEQGLSLTEFAAKAGVTDKTLARARRGQPLRHSTFGRIIAALGGRQRLERSA